MRLTAYLLFIALVVASGVRPAEAQMYVRFTYNGVTNNCPVALRLIADVHDVITVQPGATALVTGKKIYVVATAGDAYNPVATTLIHEESPCRLSECSHQAIWLRCGFPGQNFQQVRFDLH